MRVVPATLLIVLLMFSILAVAPGVMEASVEKKLLVEGERDMAGPVILRANTPAPEPRISALKDVEMAKSSILAVIRGVDMNNDKIEDLLYKRLTNDFYKPNDTIKVVVSFNVVPALSDKERNLQLRTILADITRRLLTVFPQVKVGYIYSAALVGFSLTMPANLTLLQSLRDYLSKIDINGDGLGDLLIISDANKKIKLYNYYSAKTLGIRPVVWIDIGINGSGVTASVSDTGVDDSHVGIMKHLVAWYNASDSTDTTPEDQPSNWCHGTHVAGEIVATYEGSEVDAQGRVVWTFTYSNADFSQSGTYIATWTSYYVNATGTIEISVYPSPGFLGDQITGLMLYYAGKDPWALARSKDTWVRVASISVSSNTWNTLTYDVTSPNQFGFYIALYNVSAGWLSGVSMAWIVKYPKENPTDGYPYLSGMAPGAKLAFTAVFSCSDTACMAAGLDWIAQNAATYNITTHNMSWGIVDRNQNPTVDPTIEQAVTNLALTGVIPLVAAGNDGPGSNTAGAGSPQENNYAITVAAVAQWVSNITYYSSQGGSTVNYTGVYKPDAASIGGSVYSFEILSCDCNDGDSYSPSGGDVVINDSQMMQGTSMATPHMTGIATLASAAYKKVFGDWPYSTSSAVLFVKNVMLMSTFETYPMIRERNATYSPTLDKGGKDVHEGYGVVDPVAVVEAILSAKSPLLPGTTITGRFRHGYLYKFSVNGQSYTVEYGRSVWNKLFYLPNKTITLPDGTTVTVNYKFKLYLNTSDIANTDFDLYLYNYTGNTSGYIRGEPIILAKSVNGFGQNETITYTPSKDGEYVWVVVKRATENSSGGPWILVTGPSIEEYGQPYGGTEPNESKQAWIGWPIKINGTTTKDVSRIVLEIWASNGIKLATLDSANGDITIVDPAYYNIYEATWTVPYDSNLVGQTLTVVGYYYDSTGTLTEGPVAVANIVVNAAPEPIPEPSMLPLIVLIALIALIVLASRKLRV